MALDLDDSFDELAEWVATAMTAALGDEPAERRVIAEAVARYAVIRRRIDPDEPWSYVTHYLAGDGIAHRRARVPAFLRVTGAGRPEIARWCELVGEVERQLEVAELGSSDRNEM